MRFLRSYIALTFALLIGLSGTALAQPEDPDALDDTPVPITGIELLLVAGGALGGYRLFSKSKKED